MCATVNVDNLVNAVTTFLSSKRMLACEAWIRGVLVDLPSMDNLSTTILFGANYTCCVEYCIGEGTTNVKEIQDIALQQWLLHNLTEICPGSLPANMASIKKTVLYGEHVLQINSAIDISIPAYQQYLKLKKTDLENINATMNLEEKISSKRMLKLDMTDGKQRIFGIEYDIISSLNTDIKPGCKILIKGPIQCMEGMLLLTGNMVEMLGGEVPEMAKSHSLATQLATMLGLTVIEDVDIIPVDADNTSTNNTSTTQSSRQNDNQSTPQLHQRSITSNSTHRNIEPFDNPIDLDLYEMPNEKVGKRQSDVENTAPEKRLKVDRNPVNSVEYPDNDDLADLFDNEEDLREFENDIDERINKSMEELLGSVELASEPFVYIKQINELSDSAKHGKVFKVKAQILTVLKKLTLTDRWNLRCTLIDGTGCIDVDISSDILSKCLGFTPQAIRELRKKIATNPEIKNQINLAFEKTTKTLKTLYCIIELTMSTSPEITRLIDFEKSHIDLLQRRLDACGL